MTSDQEDRICVLSVAVGLVVAAGVWFGSLYYYLTHDLSGKDPGALAFVSAFGGLALGIAVGLFMVFVLTAEKPVPPKPPVDVPPGYVLMPRRRTWAMLLGMLAGFVAGAIVVFKFGLRL